jgi:hypothetical protein
MPRVEIDQTRKITTYSSNNVSVTVRIISNNPLKLCYPFTVITLMRIKMYSCDTSGRFLLDHRLFVYFFYDASQ